MPILLRDLLDVLPPAPAPSLDALLDSATACLARHGMGRTTMTDLANEMGVARSTLYRQVSSVEQAGLLLCSRELHRFFDTIGPLADEPVSAESLGAWLAAFVNYTAAHPVIDKMRSDEPAMLGEFALRHGELALQANAQLFALFLRRAMDAGQLASHDPIAASEWILHVVASLVAAPTATPVAELIEAFLVPVFRPR